ncbi:MAG: hypothetical protein WAS05_00745 [Candidatus Nanopelagicales bacterium]
MHDLVAATEKAIKAADHLTDADEGAVEALRVLAYKIQHWDEAYALAVQDAEEEGLSRPRIPQNDNVSLASYLKYCNDLGLTPAGRDALGLTEEAPRERSKLAELRSLNGGKKAAGK